MMTASPPPAARRPLPGLRLPRSPWWLAAPAVLAALAGAVLTARTVSLAASGPAANRAVLDHAATRQVTTAVSRAVATVYSYRGTDPAATGQAARVLLAGQAARQYRELFPAVARAAGRQQLTVATTVVRAGVMRLSGNSADLLLFLDQRATRAGGTPAWSAAQLAVTAQFSRGRWRITGIHAR